MRALTSTHRASLAVDGDTAPLTIVADVAPHPLTDEGRRTQVLALERDTTVAALVQHLGPSPREVEVLLDGQYVAAERWHDTVLRDGQLVAVYPAVHGRRVFSLLTIAASIFVPQLLGLSGLTSALVSGAIKVIGGIVANALFPVRTPDVGGAPAKPDPVYSLTGGANTARLYEPMALVLGTHRLFPDLAAKEYTEFDGDNQFLHQLFHCGLGDLILTDYRVGATPIGDFSDVTTQVKRGGTITVVAGNVDTTAGAALEDDSFVERMTGADTTRIGVDISARLFELNDTGGFDAVSVTLAIQYEKLGTAAITHSVTLTHDKQSPLRRTFAYDLPEAGTWTVRVRRTSDPSGDDRVYDDVTWSALRSYQPDEADYTGQTRIAMRIKASGQLTGRLDRFSVLASQRIPVFDADAGRWTPDNQRSSNPAAVFRWYARGVAIAGSTRAGVGLAPGRIDDEVLGAWYRWCDDQDLTCDTVLRGGATHDDTLTLIAQCGRAAVSWATGKLAVVYEDAERIPTGLVSPANVMKGTFRVEYAQGTAADEVVVRYLEPDLDWQYNSVRRTRPGLTGPPQTTATITARGIVKRANAARECNLQVARQYYHRRRLLWEMGREGRSLRKGHVVWITHSLIDGGFAGRVAALESATRVRLDRPVNLTADDHLLLRLASGDLHQSAVSRPADAPAAGDVDTVELGTALPDDALGQGETIDIIWRLYDAALEPVKARIIAVEPVNERRFKFTAIDEVAAYHTLATSDLSAPFPMRPSRLPRVVDVRFVPERIRVGAGYAVQLDALLTVAGDWRGAVVRAGPDASTLSLVERLVDGDTTARWLVPLDTDQYVQIVPGTEAAQAGPVWTGTWSHEGVPPPPPVTAFSVSHLADGHRIYAFTPPEVPDLAGVAVRYASDANAAWGAMTRAHEGLLPASPYESVRPAAAGTYTFEARAVNTAGIESTGVRATVTLPVVSGGLNWTGPWDAAHTYALHDVAAHAGNAWVSLRGGNLNQEPAEGSMWWDLLVRHGTDGTDGTDGIDGLPGTRGLAGYAHAIARSTRVAAYTSVDTASEWHLTGATGAWTGDRTLRLGGVGATERALLERIAVGALVTVFDDAGNWADYTLRSAPAFSGTGAAVVARLALRHLEHVGAQPTSGAVTLHFTPAGADGLPGNRGLAGYSDRIRRTNKRTSAAAAGQADEWFLTGAGATWVGNRTFTMGGLTEAEEALLGGIAQGALVTLYQGADGWADYTLRSAVTFVGTGANRRADLSLAYVESIGVQDPAAAVEFHFTRAGADGQPGNRGLAGYSDRIRRTDKRTSAAAAGQADEWFLTGAGATWVGNRTFTMGGLTEAEEALLGGIVQGALVTLYQSADGWADYTLRSAVAFVGAGMSRRADLSLAYVESIGVQDPAAAVEFHFTRAGADGLPGNRGLSGYSHSLRRTDKRASAAAASQANEWFLTGAGATWVGNRTLSLGGITEAEEPLLERLGDGALVTVYQGAGQWADYTLGGLVAFVGTGPNRRADLSLVYVESLGAQDETQAVAFHFTAAGVPAPRLGLTLYQSANSRGLRIGGGGSKEGIAAIMDVAAPIRDFSSLIVTAYGQPRGLWGSTSIEVPTNAIPEHDETPPPGTPWWVQEEGETYLRLYFAEGRDAHEATQAYLNVASAQRLHWRRAGPEKRVRILQVLGIAGGAEPDAAVGSATITEFSDGTVTSTRTEYAYIRAASAPTAPAGGGSTYQHAPTGWTFATSSTSPLTATATQDVYRVSRVATFSSATQSSGTFTSAAAWGSVTKVLDRTGPTTVTRTEYAYIRGVTVPDLPTGGASTYQHSPTGWTFSTSSTNPLSPTQTENVYRVQRTATFAVGGFSAANFQQATAWSTRTRVASATGSTASTRTEYAYIRAASAPVAPAGGGSTYQHSPAGWTFATSSSSPLTATTTQDVYRVRRVATFSSATQSSSTFTSATAWGSVTKVVDRVATVAPAAPTNVRVVWGDVTGDIRAVEVRWSYGGGWGTGTSRLFRLAAVNTRTQGRAEWGARGANLRTTTHRSTVNWAGDVIRFEVRAETSDGESSFATTTSTQPST